MKASNINTRVMCVCVWIQQLRFLFNFAYNSLFICLFFVFYVFECECVLFVYIHALFQINMNGDRRIDRDTEGESEIVTGL